MKDTPYEVLTEKEVVELTAFAGELIVAVEKKDRAALEWALNDVLELLGWEMAFERKSHG